MSNNVVMFPKSKIENPANISKLEDIQQNMEMMKHYHIQETILNITPMIFNQLDIAGFGLSDDENEDIKDGALIVEALRSMMCKYYGIYHPFQIIADTVFLDEDQEKGSFKIAENLNIELKNPETE